MLERKFTQTLENFLLHEPRKILMPMDIRFIIMTTSKREMLIIS